MQELDDIELKVSNNLISREEGAREIMALVFQNYRLFGLYNLSEDQIQDFLIFLLPSFKRIFSVYKRESASFTTFVRGNITRNLSTWKRKEIRASSSQKCLLHSCQMNFEEKEYEYSEQEFEAELNCPDNSEIEKEFLKKFNSDINASIEKLNSKPRSHKANPQLKVFKETRNIKETVLVLYLKSCYYVDEKITEKVSLATEIPEEKLKEMVLKIYECMKRKIEKHSTMINCRDTAFFYHKRFLLELKDSAPYTGPVESLEEKYTRQTARWQKVNSDLQQGEYSVIPSNRLVAQITGITEHKVNYLLKNAMENTETVNIRNYYISHHTYFSPDLLEEIK